MNKQQLHVYYDGLCPICSREIQVYRNKDLQEKIRYVDIHSSHFDAKKEGLNPDLVHKIFHVKDNHGVIYSGVDGFVKIWDTLHIFGPLSKLAKLPASRPVFLAGYFAFSKIRPLLTQKNCEDGTCQVKS